MPNSFVAESRRYPVLLAWIAALFIGVAALVAFEWEYRFEPSVYVPLHTGMHVFSMVVAWLVFAIGWNSQDPNRTGSTTLLACFFLAVALIDFGHTLSYQGMPDLVTPASPQKAIAFSLGSRGFAAIALLAFALGPQWPLKDPRARYLLLLCALTIVALFYWLILFHQDKLPKTFEPERGLTPFKVGAEYTLVALHVTAAVLFYVRFRQINARSWAFLFTASIVMGLSQSLNALYSHPYDAHNFLSHAYRVAAYILIYRGIFLSAIREPYRIAARLQAQLKDSADRLRDLSARLQKDIEVDRRRIAQSLHDEMGQSLTALRLDADWIQRHAPDHPGVYEAVDRMQRTIEESAIAMRRIVVHLRPRVLDDLGIVAAARALTEDVRKQSGLDITLTTVGEMDHLHEAVQTALYRILQESLTNITRHAVASRVDVRLIAAEDYVQLSVRDDGRGFAPEAAQKRDSFGLFGMAERVGQLSGTLNIRSAPGEGTSIDVKLPALSRPDMTAEPSGAIAS